MKKTTNTFVVLNIDNVVINENNDFVGGIKVLIYIVCVFSFPPSHLLNKHVKVFFSSTLIGAYFSSRNLNS